MTEAGDALNYSVLFLYTSLLKQIVKIENKFMERKKHNELAKGMGTV